MHLTEPFGDRALTQPLVERMMSLAERLSPRQVRLMEVCGSHTMSFFRTGVRSLLPDNVTLLSGPGCPVCVTPNRELDQMIALASLPNVTVATFGDMLRVPGSRSSLVQARTSGADVRVVYSPMDALTFAEADPSREVVFLGVGFETTAPTVAATVLEAARRDLRNFSVLVAHKLVPPALRALLTSGEVRIDAFILPGHVSTIIGAQPYAFLESEFGIPSVIAGFLPTDLLEGVVGCLELVAYDQAEVRNRYARFVRERGNVAAKSVLEETFEPCDAEWRGFGVIPESGLRLRPHLRRFDALERFTLDLPEPREVHGCLCGEVLKGMVSPDECKLFGTACSPENPIGPCMVSSEGACAAHYKYGAHRAVKV
ncbi:MAG: hydrogenase formation protein HypD [Fimbriimonadia bacterium]|jgi:hydrogenase expression/formation protein HypD